MLVPLITPRKPSKRLERRKGGGGGGGRGGGGGSSGRGGSGGKSSGSSSGSKGSSGSSSKTSPSISSGGKTISSKSYGAGGGTPAAIPAGQLFAGRMAGGGTRGQVFGSKIYGSGYPGITGAGVAGRGFPFYFWPVVWGSAAGLGTAAYLHNDEYGLPNNSSRPGGAMTAAAFKSTNSTANISTFRIVSDNATVVSLISDISSNCSSYLNAADSSASPSEYNAYPVPEQVIQYYRASSVALTLDGYNNSAVYGDDGAPDSLLPSNTDTALLDCLNQTIGLAAPLSSGAISLQLSFSHLNFVGLIYVLWNVFFLF